MKRRNYLIIAVILTVILSIGFIFFSLFEYIPALIETLNKQVDALSRLHPFFLILGITLLPLIGIPISPLYVLGAAAYGINGGLLYGSIGTTANIALSYWLTNSFLRKPLLKYLKKKGYTPPSVPPGERTRVILFMRITLGIPLFVQNYLLGLAGIPFIQYFVLSIPFQLLYVVLFVVTGGAFFQSKFSLVFLGVAGIIAVSIIIHFVRRYYNARRNAK